MSDDLKPCPFCGGGAVTASRKMTSYGETLEYVVSCNNGGVGCPATRMHFFMPKKEWAISAWNARADADYIEKLEAKLAKAVEAMHFYADFHEAPNDGPWGINSDDFGTNALAVLAELEGEPLGAEFEAVWDANKEELYQS